MTIKELLDATGLTANDLVPIWDAEAASSVEPTQKITAAQFAAAVKTLANLQGKLTFDTTPTAGSTNPVTSGGIKTAIAQSMSTSVINNALLNAGAKVTALNARRSGNVAFVSFALTDGTTDGTTLFTFDPSIMPAYIDGIYALYNGSGVQITTGSVWIERDNRGRAKYYGSTTVGTLYCTMIYLIN